MWVLVALPDSFLLKESLGGMLVERVRTRFRVWLSSLVGCGRPRGRVVLGREDSRSPGAGGLARLAVGRGDVVCRDAMHV
jgi:hypothetical protein